MKYYVDTNTILRYLLADNIEQYRKTLEIFEKARTGNISVIILESVLVECMYVLLKFYKVPKEEVVEKLKNLMNYKGVKNPDKKELLEALNMYKEKNIHIVDCILHVKAAKSKSRLFAFDEKLLKIK